MFDSVFYHSCDTEVAFCLHVWHEVLTLSWGAEYRFVSIGMKVTCTINPSLLYLENCTRISEGSFKQYPYIVDQWDSQFFPHRCRHYFNKFLKNIIQIKTGFCTTCTVVTWGHLIGTMRVGKAINSLIFYSSNAYYKWVYF